MTALAELVPTAEEATKALDETRRMAAVNLSLLLPRIATMALDDRANLKALLDAAEFNYKVSGLAAKQAAQSSPFQTRISFNFNSKPTTRTTPRHEPVTVEAEVVSTDDIDLEPPETPSPIAKILAKAESQLEVVREQTDDERAAHRGARITFGQKGKFHEDLSQIAVEVPSQKAVEDDLLAGLRMPEPVEVPQSLYQNADVDFDSMFRRIPAFLKAYQVQPLLAPEDLELR